MNTFTPKTLIESAKINENFEGLADGTMIESGAITPAKITNPYKFLAYLGSNQTTVATTFTKLNMNTEVYDTNSNYSTSTYGYTAPVTGYYTFTARALLQSQAGVPFLISLSKDGTNEYHRLAEIPNTTGNITIGGTVDLYLTAGEVIYPMYYSVSASKTLLASLQYTCFSGRLISET